MVYTFGGNPMSYTEDEEAMKAAPQTTRKRVILRLSESQYALILAKAMRSHDGNVSAFMRSAAVHWNPYKPSGVPEKKITTRTKLA